MRDEELKQRVTDVIDTTVDIYNLEDTAELVLQEIESTHYIEPKGEPINPEDVRKGDWVRIECADGDIVKRTALGPHSSYLNDNFYLLDRPDPDADFKFPDKDGAVVRMTPKAGDIPRTAAIRDRGSWRVAGATETRKEDNLRLHYCDFEVLSDGSDQ